MERLYVAFVDNVNFENTLVGVYSSFEDAMRGLAEANPEVANLKWEVNDAGTIYSAYIFDEYDEIIVSFDIFETVIGKRTDYAVSIYY